MTKCRFLPAFHARACHNRLMYLCFHIALADNYRHRGFMHAHLSEPVVMPAAFICHDLRRYMFKSIET